MKTVHIVSHTHWDREWYKTFQVFRVKLVSVLDSLINILEADPDFSSFLLDGQTSVLEDYLEIRPEQKERLRALVQAGRIRVGPWYIQPEEFQPDGESMIRNLMLGISQAEDFGGSMKIGYLPDSFGQSGQMPHILRGFGIDTAVMMRGVDSERIKTTEFTWEGINGDRVMAVYLPEGYSVGMFLPEDLFFVRQRLSLTMRGLYRRSTSEHVLFPNGVDHQFPQAHIPELIRKLNRRSRRTRWLHSSLEDYVDAVRSVNPDLPLLRGDLVAPVKNRVHTSIASTRIYQKQQNRKMQVLLEHYAEPAASAGWLLGAEYPAGLLKHAWKVLLQNQTHDGLGGCCTDEVHREMDQRFVDVRNIGETIAQQYQRAIASRVGSDTLLLLAFNSARTAGRQVVTAAVYTHTKSFQLLDAGGREIPYQVDRIEEVDISKMSIWTLYLGVAEPAYRIEFTFHLDFPFQVGYRVLEVVEDRNPVPAAPGVSVEENTISNERLRITIQPDGSFDMEDKQTGTVYQRLHTFEDCGDAGDTYNFSPVLRDTVVTSSGEPARIRIQQGPLKAEACIELDLEVPAALAEGDQERSADTVTLPIQTRLAVHAGSNRVELSTTVDNTALDHRLRVLFPSGLHSEVSYAETQFGTIERPVTLEDRDWKRRKWSEKPLPIYPQQRFVDINDGERGLALLNRGLPEYEIYNRPEGCVIAATLLRGVGALGKGDLLVRPGRPSGVLLPAPDAQCVGVHTLEYAVYPHSGDVDAGRVPMEAAAYQAPSAVVQNCLPARRLKRKRGFLMKYASMENMTSHLSKKMRSIDEEDAAWVEVSSEGLLISAVKKAERGEALVLRVYNSSGAAVCGASMRIGFDFHRAVHVDFYEEEKEELEVQAGQTMLPDVLPYTALTVRFER